MTDAQNVAENICDEMGIQKGGVVMYCIIEHVTAALQAAVAAEREACLLAVAEQRCERDTTWDAALLAAMRAIRARTAQGETT